MQNDPVPGACAWCGKPLAGEIARPKDRPGWCHDCSTTHGDVAVFKCNSCGRIVGGIKPGRLDTGYIVAPNQVLHVDRCPKCTPNLDRCTCIEFEKWIALTGGAGGRAVEKTP